MYLSNGIHFYLKMRFYVKKLVQLKNSFNICSNIKFYIMRKQFYIWTQENQHSEKYFRSEHQADLFARSKNYENYEIREIYTR